MQKLDNGNETNAPSLDELQSARQAKVARVILVVLGVFLSAMSIMFYFSGIVSSVVPVVCCAAIAVVNFALAGFASDRVAKFFASLLGF